MVVMPPFQSASSGTSVRLTGSCLRVGGLLLRGHRHGRQRDLRRRGGLGGREGRGEHDAEDGDEAVQAGSIREHAHHYATDIRRSRLGRSPARPSAGPCSGQEGETPCGKMA